MRRNISREFFATVRSQPFVISVTVATLSSAFSGVLYYIDVVLGYRFMADTVPDSTVFSTVMMFAGLVAAFRTGHSLVRYTDAAGYIHKLNSCWFDSASTLMAFCRVSEASEQETKEFQHTLVRLVSLLSAMSMNSLQSHGQPSDEVYVTCRGDSLPLLSPEGLDSSTKEIIASSQAKVECIFQLVQQLVIDSMRSRVLAVAPPILSRTFQDLAAGLQTYHEAKKLSEVPLPFAYAFATLLILASVTCYVPCMMVVYVKGVFSAVIFTWGTLFMLWYLNCVAEALSNPFSRDSHALDPGHLQERLNLQLTLLQQYHLSTPGVVNTELAPGISEGTRKPRASLRQWVSINCSEVVLRSIGSRSRASDLPSVSALEELPDDVSFHGDLVGDNGEEASPDKEADLQDSPKAPPAVQQQRPQLPKPLGDRPSPPTRPGFGGAPAAATAGEGLKRCGLDGKILGPGTLCPSRRGVDHAAADAVALDEDHRVLRGMSFTSAV